MAITAKFESDFSDFKAGVEEAEKDLAKLGASAERTGTSLERVTAASAKGVAPASRLGDSYRQFDGVLKTVGINIGPHVQALEDLQTAAGKGGEKMGGLAKAGLVVGAGMAAWGITRAAMEFLDLDKAVAKTWSTLLGWDAVGEAGAARLETLAKASKAAGHAITDYTEAIKINEVEARKQASIAEAPAKLAAYELALKAVTNEAGRLTAAQQETIVKALALGESTGDIAKGMSISSGAVEVFVKNLKFLEAGAKDAAAAADQLAKLDAKSIEETAQLWREFGVQKIALSGTETDARIADIKRWRDDEIAKLDERTANYQQNKDAILALSKQQVDAQMVDWDFLRATSVESLQETADKARATYDEMISGSRTFTREALEAQLQKVRETAEAATAMGQAYTEGLDPAILKLRELRAEFARLAVESQKAWDALKKQNAKGISQDITAQNVMDVAQGQGAGFNQMTQLQKLLAEGYAPADALKIIQGAPQSDFTPKKEPGSQAGPLGRVGGGALGALGGGPGVTVTANVNVSGVMDTASRAALAKVVAEEVTRAYLQTRRVSH